MRAPFPSGSAGIVAVEPGQARAQRCPLRERVGQGEFALVPALAAVHPEPFDRGGEVEPPGQRDLSLEPDERPVGGHVLGQRGEARVEPFGAQREETLAGEAQIAEREPGVEPQRAALVGATGRGGERQPAICADRAGDTGPVGARELELGVGRVAEPVEHVRAEHPPILARGGVLGHRGDAEAQPVGGPGLGPAAPGDVVRHVGGGRVLVLDDELLDQIGARIVDQRAVGGEGRERTAQDHDALDVVDGEVAPLLQRSRIEHEAGPRVASLHRDLHGGEEHVLTAQEVDRAAGGEQDVALRERVGLRDVGGDGVARLPLGGGRPGGVPDLEPVEVAGVLQQAGSGHARGEIAEGEPRPLVLQPEVDVAAGRRVVEDRAVVAVGGVEQVGFGAQTVQHAGRVLVVEPPEHVLDRALLRVRGGGDRPAAGSPALHVIGEPRIGHVAAPAALATALAPDGDVHDAGAEPLALRDRDIADEATAAGLHGDDMVAGGKDAFDPEPPVGTGHDPLAHDGHDRARCRATRDRDGAAAPRDAAPDRSIDGRIGDRCGDVGRARRPVEDRGCRLVAAPPRIRGAQQVGVAARSARGHRPRRRAVRAHRQERDGGRHRRIPVEDDDVAAHEEGRVVDVRDEADGPARPGRHRVRRHRETSLGREPVVADVEREGVERRHGRAPRGQGGRRTGDGLPVDRDREPPRAEARLLRPGGCQEEGERGAAPHRVASRTLDGGHSDHSRSGHGAALTIVVSMRGDAYPAPRQRPRSRRSTASSRARACATSPGPAAAGTR